MKILIGIAVTRMQPNSIKIWGFFIGMFWVSLVTYFVLWRSFRLVVDMRDREQASAYARPQQFTVLVRDIPKHTGKESRIQQVEQFFARTHPDAYNRVQLVHNVKKVSNIEPVFLQTRSRFAAMSSYREWENWECTYSCTFHDL